LLPVKYTFLLLLCLVISLPSLSQEPISEEITKELEKKIAETEGAQKLVFMDSLSNHIAFDTAFQDDSIIQQTLAYAIELDSFDIAVAQAANLIYYQNNIKGNPIQGKELLMNALQNASKIDNHRILYKLYLEGGDSYYFIEDHDNAMKYYDLAILEADKAGYQRGIGVAKLYKGGSLSFTGKYAEASKIFQEAAVIFKREKDTFNIIGAKNSLSVLYSQNDFFEEAHKEREEAITLAKKIGSTEHLVSFYYNAATDAGKKDDTKAEISYLNLALDANAKNRNSDVMLPVLYSNLIPAYAKADSLSKAKSLLRELEKDPAKFTEGINRENYVKILKNLAFVGGNMVDAIRYGNEHLAFKYKGNHYEEIELAESFLARVYEKMGDKVNAYSHLKNATRLKDSISNVQRVKALTYYQTLYETEKRDATIASQQKDIQLLDATNRIKNQWMIVGAMALLSIFGFILFMRSRTSAKKRQQMQEVFSQDLIKAQEEERTRVARDLHDSVGQKLMLLTKQTKTHGDTALQSLAGSTLEELRNISRGLHPATIEKLGVTAAIETMVNEVDANSSIFFTNEIENIDALLSREDALHLYRIIQEVLGNMVKHSQAKAASVVLRRDEHNIRAVIKDDGVGFDYAEKQQKSISLGMKTLMERTKIIRSKLFIESIKNKGTTVSLQIPSL